MSVYAFDTDGTLDSSNGPVKVEWLKQLQRSGHAVWVVSPSPFYPKDAQGRPLFRMANGLLRPDNLRTVRAAHPGVTRFVYVSDNNDQGHAAATGFEYIDAKAFRPFR